MTLKHGLSVLQNGQQSSTLACGSIRFASHLFLVPWTERAKLWLMLFEMISMVLISTYQQVNTFPGGGIQRRPHKDPFCPGADHE